MLKSMSRLRFAFGCVAIALLYAQLAVCNAPASESTQNELGKLEESVKDIDVSVADQQSSVKARLYQGAGLQRPFIIESQKHLDRLMRSYGFHAPKVDFEKEFVVFMAAFSHAAVKVSASGLTLKDGEVADGQVVEFYRDSTDIVRQKRPFVLIVLPNTLLGK